MKKLTALILLFPLLAASCRKEEAPTTSQPNPEPAPEPAEISISISSTGFSDADASGETVSITEFSDGDACGLYILNDGKITASNIRIVASDKAGQIAWEPEDGTALDFEEGQKYFLYYPYQETDSMEDLVAGTADANTTAEDLFAGLVSGWTPATDQSDQEKFAAADLMIAEGVAAPETGGTVPVAFGLTHCMALAVIQKPQTVYDFEEDYLRDYTVSYDPSFTGRTLLENNGTYLCLVNPVSAPEIEVLFGDDGKETINTGNIGAGTYRTFSITETDQCSLTIGDYYCRADDGKGYIIPQSAVSAMDNDTQVVGVVFYKGRHSKDNLSDYTQPLSAEGTALGKDVHGYAVALTDANNGDADQLKWSSKAITKPDDADWTLDHGTSTDMTDWNGYYNCCRINGFVTEYDGTYTMADFPAAFAAANYGNRRVDADGHATEDYGWQTRFIAPSDCSGWFLPSAGQLTEIYNCKDLLAGQIGKINAIITDSSREYVRWITSISRYVWSSTEYGSSPGRNAYAVYFNGGTANWQNKYGVSNAYAVRPVLAF